ncbi:MAG: YtxH domain-containing protein, partial [Anaerolineae bacterium]|nr:YtxH domain-containing protein [Anaerolineae bacterium]
MMRKFFVFLVGFLVGVWTGGMLSLLFAPESGSELQLRIREGVDELVEEGRSAAEIRRRELEEQLESFKQGRPITLQTADETVET